MFSGSVWDVAVWDVTGGGEVHMEFAFGEAQGRGEGQKFKITQKRHAGVF